MLGCLASVYSTSWGIRDRINSLLVSIWVFVFLQLNIHISQSSGIYSRIPATPDNFNLLFIRVSLWVLRHHALTTVPRLQKYTVSNLIPKNLGYQIADSEDVPVQFLA